MGRYFPKDVVTNIYHNFGLSRKIIYTETSYGSGSSYNAVYTIFDKSGSPSIMIMSGMPITYIHTVMSSFFMEIFLVSLFFVS